MLGCESKHSFILPLCNDVPVTLIENALFLENHDQHFR